MIDQPIGPLPFYLMTDAAMHARRKSRIHMRFEVKAMIANRTVRGSDAFRSLGFKIVPTGIDSIELTTGETICSPTHLKARINGANPLTLSLRVSEDKTRLPIPVGSATLGRLTYFGARDTIEDASDCFAAVTVYLSTDLFQELWTAALNGHAPQSFSFDFDGLTSDGSYMKWDNETSRAIAVLEVAWDYEHQERRNPRPRLTRGQPKLLRDTLGWLVGSYGSSPPLCWSLS